MIGNEEQHSLEWFRARIGNITGSQVGLLMKAGRKDYFSETAKSYIYQVAAERSMNPAILSDDELFNEYLQQVDVTSKAMRWGTEQEENARELYEQLTGRHTAEVGSCRHPDIPHFASSPDGFFIDEATGEKGCLEIKCPNQATFMKYRAEVSGNDTLLAVKYEYFYQCMAHIMCTGAAWCDFIAYCPFQRSPIHIVRITPDEAVIKEMAERITKANELIDELIAR